eukprot:GEMP01057536.1.p1 GENE.GEMP01057536.1~~GEMP01057536.1.p1  ORF type:complete len:183 (+),score=42.01 GEMP01057536.1:33-581(+)
MSGFFGVTCLGPQNPFAVSLLSALGVTNFSDEDFEEVFVRLQQPDGTIAKTQIYQVLSETYGFDPMPEETNLFLNTLRLDEDIEKSISWVEFRQGLAEIRDTVNEVSKKATHYTSHRDIMDDRTKHRRKPNGPMEIFKHPIAIGQEVGWHEEEVMNERFPKKSCAETKYADALLKSGVDPYY